MVHSGGSLGECKNEILTKERVGKKSYRDDTEGVG